MKTHILNQTLNFKDLSPYDKAAFSGHVTKEIFMENTLLYRFSDHDRITSPWWSDASDLGHTLLTCLNNQQSLVDYVRQHSAVKRQWNQLQDLIIIKLNVRAFGLRGLARPQNEASIYTNKDSIHYKEKFTKPVYFKGGSSQVYIPNLNMSNISVVVPAGAVNIYDDVKDILDFLISYKII